MKAYGPFVHSSFFLLPPLVGSCRDCDQDGDYVKEAEGGRHWECLGPVMRTCGLAGLAWGAVGSGGSSGST